MKMTLVLLHIHYSTEHLEHVKSEMAKLGSPRLRGVNMGDCVYLLEGCHRARAAAALGVTVEVEEIDYNYERDGELRICDVLVDGDCTDSEMRSVVGIGASGNRCVDCEVELV